LSLVKRYGEKLGGLLWNRFTVHYTPKHGSWLNQAEIEVSLLSRQCLGQRRIGDLPVLCGEVQAWECRINHDRTTIGLKFTRKRARRKLNLFRVEFPAACGVASARALQDTSLLAARSFINVVNILLFTRYNENKEATFWLYISRPCKRYGQELPGGSRPVVWP
jgi:hypothetical protein